MAKLHKKVKHPSLNIHCISCTIDDIQIYCLYGCTRFLDVYVTAGVAEGKTNCYF